MRDCRFAFLPHHRLQMGLKQVPLPGASSHMGEIIGNESVYKNRFSKRKYGEQSSEAGLSDGAIVDITHRCCFLLFATSHITILRRQVPIHGIGTCSLPYLAAAYEETHSVGSQLIAFQNSKCSRLRFSIFTPSYFCLAAFSPQGRYPRACFSYMYSCLVGSQSKHQAPHLLPQYASYVLA